MEEEKLFYCEKCRKTMREDQFYSSNNLEKYPDGKLHFCKKCVSIHVDNWDSSTYLPILQECDVPYVPEQWNNLLKKYGQDRKKVTGMTILGRYLSAMKIKQYKEFRWKDTEHLQNLADKKTRETMRRQGYTPAEIDEAIATGKTIYDLENNFDDIVNKADEEQKISENNIVQEDYFANVNGAMPSDEELDLTDEEIVYLRLKWSNMYKPVEWVQLEQLYQEMMDSYDITAAGDINTLKLACKASLKANQLMDLGDIEGAQKMSKVYNDYMKSGKWTAAQNKTAENEIVDSIGELVALCEKDGFFEKYYIDQPRDKADRVIQDMQKYTRDLITEETGLVNLMELAFKNMQDEEEKIKEAAENSIDAEAAEEDMLFDYDKSPTTDKDFADFKEFQEEEINEDFEVVKGFGKLWH